MQEIIRKALFLRDNCPGSNHSWGTSPVGELSGKGNKPLLSAKFNKCIWNARLYLKIINLLLLLYFLLWQFWETILKLILKCLLKHCHVQFLNTASGFKDDWIMKIIIKLPFWLHLKSEPFYENLSQRCVSVSKSLQGLCFQVKSDHYIQQIFSRNFFKIVSTWPCSLFNMF